MIMCWKRYLVHYQEENKSIVIHVTLIIDVLSMHLHGLTRALELCQSM
jgi:hypothetical protein